MSYFWKLFFRVLDFYGEYFGVEYSLPKMDLVVEEQEQSLSFKTITFYINYLRPWPFTDVLRNLLHLTFLLGLGATGCWGATRCYWVLLGYWVTHKELDFSYECWFLLFLNLETNLILCLYPVRFIKFNQSVWCIRSWERNWVFATNSDFLITIYLEPNVVDLRYFKLCNESSLI